MQARFPSLRLLCLLAGGALLPFPNSCRRGPTAPSTQEREAFRSKAQAATRAFMKTLGQKLQAALQEGGPSHAISVCSKEAPRIAEEFSNDEISVHRIGTRVRNPHSGTPTLDERELMQKLSLKNPDILEPVNGKLVYLRGIFITTPLCLKCHGSPTEIDPKTQEVLTRLYPDDKATGYALHDLRGAFVVREK